MAIGTAMAGVSAGLGVASAISGIFGSKKQKKFAKSSRRAQERAGALAFEKSGMEWDIQQLNKRQSDKANRLEIIGQQRQSSMRRAEILSSAIGAGVGGGSSGTQGAISSLGTNTAVNIGQVKDVQRYQDNVNKLQTNIFGIDQQLLHQQNAVNRFSSKAGQSAANVAQWQSLFSAGQQLTNNFAGPSGLSTLFG